MKKQQSSEDVNDVKLSDRSEILEAMDERFGRDDEPEEEKEEKPDTVLTKFAKSLGYFWEYYKWYVIIPAIVIVLVVIFVASYINESREIALRIALVNTIDISDPLAAFQVDYPNDRGIDTGELPVKVEYDFQFPEDSAVATKIDDTTIAKMQKLSVMVGTGKLDVMFATPWVIDQYSLSGTTTDVREIFDEEFLEKYKDRIYYAEDDTGEVIPVGFETDGCTALGEFTDGATPVMAVFDSAPHPEEYKYFIEWVLERCE